MAVARELREVAAGIAGTSRSPRAFRALRDAGIAPLVFDGRRASLEVTSALRRTTHLLVTIPPTEDGDPVLRCCRDSILHEMPALQWVGYLSSTGVYGNHAGGWVDEGAPCRPSSSSGIRRLAAELEWQQLAGTRGTPVAVLRLPAIYGPGRNALASLDRGDARIIAVDGHWFSRIHVADVAGAAAHLARSAAGGTFNVADEEPSAPQDVVRYAASLLGVDPPEPVSLDSPDVSAALRAFYAGSRRVCSRLIRRQGYVLRYPDYRAGLAAMWERGDWR
jgi:nucleoside-diphosphate-sugar epimerase